MAWTCDVRHRHAHPADDPGRYARGYAAAATATALAARLAEAPGVDREQKERQEVRRAPDQGCPGVVIPNEPADEYGAPDPQHERVQTLRPAVRPLGRLATIWGDAVVTDRPVKAANLDMRCDETDEADRERRVDEVIFRRPEDAAARPKKTIGAAAIAFGFTPSMSGAVRLVSIRYVIVREQQFPVPFHDLARPGLRRSR